MGRRVKRGRKDESYGKVGVSSTKHLKKEVKGLKTIINVVGEPP